MMSTHSICSHATLRLTPVQHTLTAQQTLAQSGRQCGGGRLRRGGLASEREVVGALLEAVHTVLDVLGVRVDGRRHDVGEVVGEVVRWVKFGVGGAVAPGGRTRKRRRQE